MKRAQPCTSAAMRRKLQTSKDDILSPMGPQADNAVISCALWSSVVSATWQKNAGKMVRGKA
ncbi:MAG: hypothetical protein ACK56F_16330 [bacterium]